MSETENLESLLKELGHWFGHGLPTLKYVYSDFSGKFDESQWQWVCYMDDVGVAKYRTIEDTPSAAVIECLRLIKLEDNRAWRKIRKEDREAQD